VLEKTGIQNKQGIPVITVDWDEPASTRWIKPGRKIASLANELTDSSPGRIQIHRQKVIAKKGQFRFA
jgi:hypothetical protein